MYECGRVEEFVNVIEDDFRDGPELFQNIKSDAEFFFNDGCTKFTKNIHGLKTI